MCGFLRTLLVVTLAGGFAVGCISRETLTEFEKGSRALTKKDYDQAIAHFTKAIEERPENPPGYANRGEAYLRKGDVQMAIADFSKAIELAPDNSKSYYDRCRAWLSAGDRAKAKLDLQAARDRGWMIPSIHDELLKEDAASN